MTVDPAALSESTRAWLDEQRTGGPAEVFANYAAMPDDTPEERQDARARSKRLQERRDEQEQAAFLGRLELHDPGEAVRTFSALSELGDVRDDAKRVSQLEAAAIARENRIKTLEAELRTQQQRSLRALSAANQAAGAFRARVYGR